jgi:hypothetical protein
MAEWQQGIFLARNVEVVDRDDGEQVVTGEFLLTDLEQIMSQLRPKPPRP